MQLDEVSYTTLKSCWMKLATMSQVLAAINVEESIDGMIVRNLGFCIHDIALEVNEILEEIIGDKNEECSEKVS